MALTVANDVFKGVYVVGRVVAAFLDFLMVADDKEMPRSQKIFRIASDALTIITQTAALGATVARAAPDTRLALDTTAGVADITQRVALLSGKEGPIGWGDYLDIGGGVLLRVASIVNDAIVFKPEFFGQAREGVGCAANVAEIVGNIAANHSLLGDTWERTARLVRYLSGHPLVVVAPNQRPGNPIIYLAPANAEPIYRMKQMQTINELEEIPEVFHSNDVLRRFVCALSNKPIRYLLVVAGTEGHPQPVYFESRLIVHRLQEGGPAPALWPAGVAFVRSNLREFPAMQSLIDTKLNEILEEIHRSDLRFEPLENFAHPESERMLQMVAILKALKLERMNQMQDMEICDAIVARVSPMTIANVCVATIWHKFQAEGQPKLTKAIRLVPTVTLMEKPPLNEEELFAATRAALISQNQSDRRALLLAQIPFEIRVSTDLQDLEICSEFVRSNYQRKREILEMMKTTLRLEQLNALSDTDLADRIVAVVIRKTIASVFVSSIAYQFSASDEPRPARAITFVPLVSGGRRASSVDSLFAAARSIFGSQSEIDRTELSNRHRPLIIYVEMNFQNVDIQEIS